MNVSGLRYSNSSFNQILTKQRPTKNDSSLHGTAFNLVLSCRRMLSFLFSTRKVFKLQTQTLSPKSSLYICLTWRICVTKAFDL